MDIRINQNDWDALDPDARKKITEVIDAYFKGSRIVPDPAGPPLSQRKAIPNGKGFCEAACNIVEAAARAACLAIGDPIAMAACIALAEEGGKECRRHC